MKKSILALTSLVVLSLFIVGKMDLTAATEQQGGQWHHMWLDQWDNNNYQCQPVQQNPTCWPIWAWKINPA